MPLGTKQLTGLVAVIALCGGCSGVKVPTGSKSSQPAASHAAQSEQLGASAQPPVDTPREGTFDVLHGQRVEDPYRWLEAGASEAVRRWTDAQNAHTRAVLDKVAGREGLRADIVRMIEVGSVEAPVPRRTRRGVWRYFYLRREGLQNQPVLYVREGLRGRDLVVLDLNTSERDETVAMDWFFPSEDGRLVAYGLSANGSEDSTLHVVEVGEDGIVHGRQDRIEQTRHCSLAWKPDSSGFYYTRYPARGAVPEGEEQYHRAVYEHVLGTDPDADPKLFGDGRAMTDSPAVALSPNGRWLVVVVFQGWAKSEVYLRDLHAKRKTYVPVAAGRDARYAAVALDDRILLLTDDGAPRGRVVAVDPAHPQRERWTEIVGEGPDALDEMEVVGEELVLTVLRDASTVVQRRTLAGKPLAEVKLPTLGTARVTGARNGDELFVEFSSFVLPGDVYRLAHRREHAGELEPWQGVRGPIEAARYEVLQHMATSKDGTQVPYFVVRQRGMASDGSAAAVLTGYGGFNISMVPGWLGGACTLLERGIVVVQAALRGGGEYGEAWHQAGMLAHKQNVFDDMTAVAEDVKARGIADGSRLGIMGGSNGGLLVNAMITQHPSLFQVAVARVPLTDMLRYENFLVAKLWAPEYGSASDPKMFRVLLAYSPYHNVHRDVSYPATLLTSAVSDSRVDPSHARKMAAALQWASGGRSQILLRLETHAGHGAGKPTSKRVDELVDMYSFVVSQLGDAGGR